MTIKGVALRRIFNIGNYENIQPELIADLDKGDDPQTALKILETEINNYVKYTRVGNPVPENKKVKYPVNAEDGNRFKKLEVEDDE